MPNLTDIIEMFNLIVALKIVILIILFLYLIFTFILLTQVKALNRLIYVHSGKASQILFSFSVIYFLAVLSLLFIAIVIL